MSINNTEYINKYKINYTNGEFSRTVTIAEEVVQITNEGQVGETITSYFRNVLNLSQLTTTKTGTKINPEKAREVLDTNIFELLPTQTTRQDQINEFFNEFNDLIGQAPAIQDVDGDGVGEYIQPSADELDEENRVSYENKSSAYITRLDSHANTNNQGKTLESMRNKLNTYLGDVDNVVQVIEDQRPEYENKLSGFLKIRKQNQAIILRNPNQMLEFQKIVTRTINGIEVTGPSFLMDGFTITMWVRFVGKTGRGTLFNFGNPLSSLSPYGFRLETTTLEDVGVYKRMVRLVVRDDLDFNTFNDHNNGKLYDSSYGGPDRNKHNTITTDSPSTNFYDYTPISTDDLNEWFFICATYNPEVNEELSHTYTDYLQDKEFWLNHRNTDGTLAAQGIDNIEGGTNNFVGAKCKVEIISRSDLLRARGYKVDSLEVNTESD